MNGSRSDSNAKCGIKRARSASSHPLRDAFRKGYQQKQRLITTSSSDVAKSAALDAATNFVVASAKVRAECNHMGLELSDTAVSAAVARASTVQGALNLLLDQGRGANDGNRGANHRAKRGGLTKWLSAGNNNKSTNDSISNKH